MVHGSRLHARWYKRGKGRRTARIRQIMREPGNREHGPRHHLPPWGTACVFLVSPQTGTSCGKLNQVLSPLQHLEEGRQAVLL